MHPKAKLLRSQLSSNVLGGLQLDDFISEEELEALEACVAALLLATVTLHSLTHVAPQGETQKFRHDICSPRRPWADRVHFARGA